MIFYRKGSYLVSKQFGEETEREKIWECIQDYDLRES